MSSQEAAERLNSLRDNFLATGRMKTVAALAVAIKAINASYDPGRASRPAQGAAYPGANMTNDPFEALKALSTAWHHLDEAQAELRHSGFLTPEVRGQLETLKISLADHEDNFRMTLAGAIKDGEISAPPSEEMDP